jgi:hypothetical protein
MRKPALALLGSAAILCATTWPGEAGGIHPGYYAHSQLVYGNAEQYYAAGCLRWVYQNRSWYNYCAVGGYVVARKGTVVVKY